MNRQPEGAGGERAPGSIAASTVRLKAACAGLERSRDRLLELLALARAPGDQPDHTAELEYTIEALDEQARSLLGAATRLSLALTEQEASEAARAQAAAGGVRRLMEKLDEHNRYRARLNKEVARLKGELAATQRELARTQDSFAFRIGRLFVAGVRRPITLFTSAPREVLLLARDALARIRARFSQRPPPPSEDAPDLGAGLALDRQAVHWAEPSGEEAQIQRLRIGEGGELDLPGDPRQVRVAAIMDEFSFNAFRDCAGGFMQLHASHWREDIEEFAPHMLLVESAWKGLDGSWARKVYPLSTELVELVAWCRSRGIPTVFWNKEDPVHLSIFMRTAKQFDAVFTTDIDCVRAYKAALGHDQVYWLPFACQPEQHNPIERHERKDAFCFAGSYYAKYPERQRDFATLVDYLQALRPVEIYDRNQGSDDPTLVFPQSYARMILGALPYEKISVAYKGYRYGININTVKQSQSMFARRAFELLASNTVVVSNFSRGLRMLLGDLVVSSDSGRELADRVGALTGDERRYRKFRLAGLRKVMSDNTYQDRFGYVLERLSGSAVDDRLPNIAVVARAEDAGQLGAVLEAFEAQSYGRKALYLVLAADLAEPPPRAGVEFVAAHAAAGVELGEQGGWVTRFHPGDHYGPNYLLDLALATRYSPADAIGKQARFAMGPDGVELLAADAAYTEGHDIPLRRAMARSSRLASCNLAALVMDEEIRVAGTFAIDEFNYCESAAGRAVEEAEDLEGLWTGIPLARLHRLAETATAADLLAARQSNSRFVSAEEIAGMLPAGPHGEGRVATALVESELEITSKLPGDEHLYLYSTQPVEVERYFPDGVGKFNLEADTEMLLSLVFIFLDVHHKRIGHAIRAFSSNLTIAAPGGTAHVRFGLRVQGPGSARVKRLVLGHLPSPAAGIPARGEHLVVTRGYPAYDDLYSYVYVHKRVVDYRAAGVDVDVFRISEDPLAFAEFEGVDVVSGQLVDLELMIRSNPYRKILVHSLDRALWSLLKEAAADREILIWVHGAEIQPWYRRAFSFLDDRDREHGKQRSRDRMMLWRELFAAPPANVRFVFVSRHLAREAFRDVGIELNPGAYEVIHNHIDGDFFEYVPKSAEQRKRLLSIRPYSRPTYSNDLTVKAILELSKEPYFGELEIRLVGDGRLFEQVVEPLRGLPNVVLEQRFLTQREIRALHREYGVLLSPSRIDSQGVSRDEAMASGLVPIVSRVSAVPEFVDGSCAMLTEPEDWRGIADAVRTLYASPALFLSRSQAAAARVRGQSSAQATIGREVDLLSGRAATTGSANASPRRMRIALYGDLDLNLIDGSAIWAVSLASVLAAEDELDVDLYLKKRLRETRVVQPLLGAVNVRLVEPGSDDATLDPPAAVEAIVREDAARAYDAVILRGMRVAEAASAEARLHGRLWTYLTDLPEGQAERAAPGVGLDAIAGASAFILCQTPQLERRLLGLAASAAGKTRRLPPMIPSASPDRARSPAAGPSGGCLRVAYAGKFAPLWGIRELFNAVEEVQRRGHAIELHVFGDKVHNPPDDPTFAGSVRASLEAGRGVVWHRGVSREGVLAALQEMHIGWAWRAAALEETTPELSTKVLEYASCGAAPLVYPGPVNRDLLGDDYPLMAAQDGLVELLSTLASDRSGMLAEAADRAARSARSFGFDEVRQRYVLPLLAEAAGARSGAV